jgi:hypothetical protein
LFQFGKAENQNETVPYVIRDTWKAWYHPVDESGKAD